MNLENSRQYYGRTLQSSEDLLTDACSTSEPPPPHVRAALAHIHPEVSARYYGCGLVAPPEIEGAQILDLGCGSGRDAYVLSKLVGEQGRVVGVDATQEQLAVAEAHREWHRERFGHARPNIDFVAGDIEALSDLRLAESSFDVIVSNCVINLVEDKASVFRAAHRLLKPGGELYFSDIYADRRIPAPLRRDPVLHGECLAGALYWGDFLTLAKSAGFADPRLVSDRPLAIRDRAIEAKLEGINFFSATYRLFKLEGLEPRCEDYGQAVIYRGGIAGSEQLFALDKHHRMEAGRIFPLCGNSWRMLAETRFAPHFEFIGDFSRHFGAFAGCGDVLPFDIAIAETAGGCC
jgi:arsenite methyltransferase